MRAFQEIHITMSSDEAKSLLLLLMSSNNTHHADDAYGPLWEALVEAGVEHDDTIDFDEYVPENL